MNPYSKRGVVPGRGVRVPWTHISSGRPGPRVVVTANLHGDECTGIAVVHSLLDTLPDRLLRGDVRLYPSLNPAGFKAGKRGFPGDAMDPNRAFPGSSVGTAVQRHAHRLWTDIIGVSPGAVIDLHTDSGAAVPYAIIDRAIRGKDPAVVVERCQRLGEATGLTVLREYPRERYRRFELDRSLPGALVNGPGISAITLEIGPRRRLDPGAVSIALAAVDGILESLNMVEQVRSLTVTPLFTSGYRRESAMRTQKAGVLIPVRAPGSAHERGDVLCEVRSLDGQVLERIHARRAGYVIALPEVGYVSVGTPCATLAVPDGDFK